MEKELINYIKEFQLVDLIGFGRILGVEEEDNFEDYLTNIIVAFLNEKRKKRKQLLQLAKDIANNNKGYDMAAENIKGN